MVFDSLLHYETLKIVRIQDKRLGALYYSLCALAMCYVVGYQILYKNEHFQRHDVTGLGRIRLQHPTVNLCNPRHEACDSDFRNLTDLPYCSAYAGETEVDQRACRFLDKHSLLPPRGLVGSELLIPTRLDRLTERKECAPAAANGHACKNEYRVRDNATTSAFVADIERFTVLLSHSFSAGSASSGRVTGSSIRTAGAVRSCDHAPADTVEGRLRARLAGGECTQGWALSPIRCVNDECPFVSGATDCKRATSFLAAWASVERPLVRRADRLVLEQEPAPAPDAAAALAKELDAPGQRAAAERGVLAIPSGDVFPVQDLLHLAGVELDSKDGQCDAVRAVGTIVEVEAFYSNLRPWSSSFGGHKAMTYEYRVRTRPASEMKQEHVAQEQPDAFPEERWIDNQHGVYLILTVSGEYGEFNFVYLLVMLTTSLTLLAVATKAVDILALYVLKHKDAYNRYKYEITEEVTHDSLF